LDGDLEVLPMYTFFSLKRFEGKEQAFKYLPGTWFYDLGQIISHDLHFLLYIIRNIIYR
jgi:hypothetical protein